MPFAIVAGVGLAACAVDLGFRPAWLARPVYRNDGAGVDKSPTSQLFTASEA